MGGLKLYCRKHEFYNGICPACKGNRCDSNLPCSLKVSGGGVSRGGGGDCSGERAADEMRLCC